MLVKLLCFASVIAACLLLLNPRAVYFLAGSCLANVKMEISKFVASQDASYRDGGVDSPDAGSSSGPEVLVGTSAGPTARPDAGGSPPRAGIAKGDSTVSRKTISQRLSSRTLAAHPDGAPEASGTVAIPANKETINGNLSISSEPSLIKAFSLEAYKTATAEIRERISQEQILFALKFSIVGGILLALFSMSRSEQFEAFIQRRRTAVFFSAALLTSSVIDVRLRFDLQMVELLGKWIRQAEGSLHDSNVLGYKPWETFLEKEMFGLGLPVMRSFSLSLTALLYLVTVYIFIILPRG